MSENANASGSPRDFDEAKKKGRFRSWLLLVVAVVTLVVAYMLITNWENFMRGLKGEPEVFVIKENSQT